MCGKQCIRKLIVGHKAPRCAERGNNLFRHQPVRGAMPERLAVPLPVGAPGLLRRKW